MNQREIQMAHDGKMRSISEMLTEMGLEKGENVYRHLLKGEALSITRFAELLGKSVSEAESILSMHGELNTQHQVVGFTGITLMETMHKLLIKDTAIYTWCAADTLLFPRFLGFAAIVESADPVNGELVKLSINEDYLEWTEPVPLYISWMEKADSCDIRNSFCNHSHFFGSEATAQNWLQKNPQGKISLVEDFVSFAGAKGCC